MGEAASQSLLALTGSRVLVTGAAGFIGSHLAERLAAGGCSVRVVDCLTPYYNVARKREMLDVLDRSGCEVAIADLRTCDLRDLLEGVRVVFHEAGQPGVRGSWAGFDTYLEHNVLATHRLLEAIRVVGVPRFVYASSSSVYGDARGYPTTEDDPPSPVSPYGVTKLAAEHLCGVYAARGVHAIALRYFTVYGPRQRPDMAMHRLIEAAINGSVFPMHGDGEQVRDFTYVADVVDANLLAATVAAPAGSVVNVAGGSAVTLREVIRIVEEMVGRPVALDRGPAQPGDVRRTGGSIERAAQVLGWRPRVSLRDGLSNQVTWHSFQRALERSA